MSHGSAAAVHRFGVYLSDTPTFISKDRRQTRSDVKIYRRSAGLNQSDYTAADGFAVTTIERTAADLSRSRSDGGHLGRFIDEAVRAQQRSNAWPNEWESSPARWRHFGQ